MKIIKPSYEILSEIDRDKILQLIEIAGRTCYKSEEKITTESASKFIERMIKSGHHSVIEHFNITVRFICDRGVTHELVRHRLASYSQESTRYCNYSKDKFDNQLTFILPNWIENLEVGEYNHEDILHIDVRIEATKYLWMKAILDSEIYYLDLIGNGWSPQRARSVLPNSLKTEIVATANLREWRHILKLRTSTKAHPQIREIMIPLQEELRNILPEVFENL